MNKDNRVYTGISTDMNGGYMLKIPADLKDNLYITFSFIGYKTKKVEYKGQKVIDVTLEADAQLIDEVVVTGTASVTRWEFPIKTLRHPFSVWK